MLAYGFFRGGRTVYIRAGGDGLKFGTTSWVGHRRTRRTRRILTQGPRSSILQMEEARVVLPKGRKERRTTRIESMIPWTYASLMISVKARRGTLFIGETGAHGAPLRV